MLSWHVAGGDCLDRLRAMPDCSVDALVTDPPAGISYLGAAWDSDRGGRRQWVAWMTEVMSECLRVLKPGGHGLVWALPKTSHWTGWALAEAGFEVKDRVSHLFGQAMPKALNLKPALEDWWLVRRPLGESTIEANVARWGVGALRIDACRIPVEGRDGGRWPANVALSHDCVDVCGADCPVSLLDAQSGVLKGPGSPKKANSGAKSLYGGGAAPTSDTWYEDDGGGASKFFYCAKTSPAERDAGLEHMPADERGRRNLHPTPKPILLMRWLVRLVCGPGGTVLDPFCGTGTTGIAALLEGATFWGIEAEAGWVLVARDRIDHFVGPFLAEERTPAWWA